MQDTRTRSEIIDARVPKVIEDAPKPTYKPLAGSEDHRVHANSSSIQATLDRANDRKAPDGPSPASE